MPLLPDVRSSRCDYDAWHARAESPDARADAPWHQLLFRHLDVARDLTGRRVLEIGCGRGELAAHLVGAGPALYVAADFAPAALTFARRRGTLPSKGGWHLSRKGASHLLRGVWALTDMQAIGLRSDAFDTVISCETIEHVPDPLAALREAHRVLRPGGRLFLTTPNYLGLFGAYRIYLRATGRRYTEGGQPINHVTLLPRTRSWVRRAGLRVLHAEADGHYTLWPGRPPEAWTCPPWLRPALGPFALHSIVVAEKAR